MTLSLYREQDFKDNCGFGLIAHMEGTASHDLLKKSIAALNRMTHRGGIAADGKTGDGCGLLLQKPDAFFQKIAQRDFNTPLLPNYAVGMLFLSPDTEQAAQERACVTQHLQKHFKIIAWRVVPTHADCLGPIAKDTLPRIEQVFIQPCATLSEAERNARLFVAGKMIEKQLSDHKDFYICSLSSTTITYKGLMMPEDLPHFYPDLKDNSFKSAICVFHQRFSTNTLPRWPLAQPFRLLAHNGEINTIMGNRNWADARVHKMQSDWLPELDTLTPLINREGSDSSSMDNMLELLVTGGIDLHRALRMMVPPAWQNVHTMDPDLRAFYAYNSLLMEPWDGPAGLVISDGRRAVCMLDRNGLRPSRWVMSRDGHLVVASEIGVAGYAPSDIVATGRVGPGEMLAIDTQTGELLQGHEIDEQLKTRQPYKKWLKEQAIHLRSNLYDDQHTAALSKSDLSVHQKMFQVTLEERDQILRKMAENGQEAVGSMGDDTPLAVLSAQPRSLYDYFRQQFAQVTNPPIDPLRESIVMSLETRIGKEHNLFAETPEHAARILLKSPVLSPSKGRRLLNMFQNRTDVKTTQINLHYPSDTSLEEAIHQICQQAIEATRSGAVILHLTDRAPKADYLPIHAAMATGAIHHCLIKHQLRADTNIIVETATTRNPHHFAVLLGFGATAIYPYLAYEVLADLIHTQEITLSEQEAVNNFRRAIDKGLLKILSKMGISTVVSYRGAQLFEAIGLSDAVTALCFPGVSSRIQGATFAHLQADQSRLAQHAWRAHHPLSAGGLLKYVHGGEYHAYNPDVVETLQRAVQTGDYALFQSYAQIVDQRPPSSLRDLLALKPGRAIALDDVEPVTDIYKRFDSAAMSLGALSPEAHAALAQAMNRLGGRSNSGEGGEDPARFATDEISKIKQIASGRFGVTPHYLVNAEVLQIKIAQGAKPGEGGQLPGGKVNALIARLRYSVPGVTLISPPPHHDIYSIEDLAQLIFDLKQVNPQALVSVKLVSEPGVGTIAAGVAKAYADLITISGYDGGTGASPISSIKYAGSPWELGLAEAHQTLRGNDLRDRVRLQTDGGLKTGLDVIKAAILGAESFGFGTAPMIAMGCKYLRICHLNNCATGIATQNEHLRHRHFMGTVDMIMHFFSFVAQQVREWLAFLGVKDLASLVGRTDLLTCLPGTQPKHQGLDLRPLLGGDDIPADKPHTCQRPRNTPFDKGLKSEQMLIDCQTAITEKLGGEFRYKVCNQDRSLGARLSGEIARHHGNQGMSEHPITLHLQGSAGQSFGVWNAGGLHMILEGEANDYVGKGMTGGKLVIFPPKDSQYPHRHSSIIGNTCGYGATGGKLLASGTAGERLGVRNSGAHIVVEGSGDHCCEYMTGGVVCVLGETGINFGAGMTGGLAFVLDESRLFVDRYNHELVDIQRIDNEYLEDYRSYLFAILDEFIRETGSVWARHLISNMDDYIGKFWLVKPKFSDLNTLLTSVRERPE